MSDQSQKIQDAATRESWVEYAKSEAAKDPGMGIVGGFLFYSPDLFDKDGATPRDWTRAARALGAALAQGEDAWEDACAAMPAMVPGEGGRLLRRFLDVDRQAGLLAEAAMAGEPIDGSLAERFERHYGRYGQQRDAAQQQFGFQFVNRACLAAVAALAAIDEADEASRREIAERAASCLVAVDIDCGAFGVDHLGSLAKASLGQPAFEAFGRVVPAELLKAVEANPEAKARGAGMLAKEARYWLEPRPAFKRGGVHVL